MSSIVSLTGMSRDCRALQCKIQEIRENNSVVARTINELHQEVSDALEERIALEYQLEQGELFSKIVHPAIKELETIEPDNLSPRQAMETLYHLKNLI